MSSPCLHAWWAWAPSVQSSPMPSSRAMRVIAAIDAFKGLVVLSAARP
jgi:hypothetical protein